MKDVIRLINVQLDGDDAVVVTFSDGTTGAYVAEELLELRPYRERLRNRRILNLPIDRPKHDNSGREAQRADRQQVQDKASRR
jgi:hypothetical protein